MVNGLAAWSAHSIARTHARDSLDPAKARKMKKNKEGAAMARAAVEMLRVRAAGSALGHAVGPAARVGAALATYGVGRRVLEAETGIAPWRAMLLSGAVVAAVPVIPAFGRVHLLAELGPFLKKSGALNHALIVTAAAASGALVFGGLDFCLSHVGVEL